MGLNEKPCHKCKYARCISAGPGEWFFTGCYYGDYHGKWIAEIGNCPMKVIGAPDERAEGDGEVGMKTEEMICELRRLEEVHKDDFVGTGETNWSLMCRDVANRLEELLAAQEPRVMTWQEVIGAAIECKPLYIEVKDSEDKEPGDDRWAMVTQYKDSITNGIILAMSSYITSEMLFKDWYGKTWRCWTQRPTDEQMEAVKWAS